MKAKEILLLNIMKSFFRKLISLFNIDKEKINNLSKNIQILGDCGESYINDAIHNLSFTLFIYKVIALLMAVISVVLLVLELYSFALLGGCVCVFVIYLFIEIIKKISKEDIFVVKAKCTGRKLGGYRLQYHKFAFKYKLNSDNENNDDNEKQISIFASNKHKFSEGDEYVFLLIFNEENNNETNRVSVLSALKK